MRLTAHVFFAIAFLILPAALQAQTQTKTIARNARQAARINAPVAYVLFSPSAERDAATDAAISNVTYLKLDQEKLDLLRQEQPKVISLTLPFNGTDKTLLLYQTDIYSPGFFVRLREGKNKFLPASTPKGLYYRGILEEDDNTLVALSFFEDEVGGIISLPGSGNYNLTLNRQHSSGGAGQYLLFQEANVHGASQLFPLCAGELMGSPKPQQLKATASEEAISCRAVTLALHADYLLYLKNSSSTSATMNYLTVLFNGVATLYENDGVRLALQEMTIHITEDFYSTESSNDMLFQYGNEINVNTTADLMQLVSGHTITTSWGSDYAPLGGLAWMDVLCSDPYYYGPWETYIGPYSFVNTVGNPALPAVPVYSWDISCSTHELGHNLGSPHTHSCAWNGDDTPIDGCGPTADEDYSDPSCTVIGPIPSSSVKGTIMSYCHLLSGVGISFNNGFGPQPAALIRSKVADALCLSEEMMPALVINQPDSVVIANAFCKNGSELYCYNNQDDFDPLNDQLVLIITNFDIDILDLSNLSISMKTTPLYGSNTTPDAASSLYLEGAYSNWYVANREWSVSLNTTLPGETYYSFPFLQQDIDDLEGSFPAFGGVKDSLKWVVYRSEAAALNPEAAPASEVTRYNYGTSASGWSYSTDGYKLASIRTNMPVYGANFAVGKQEETHVSNLTNTFAISIYPNPAQEKLYLKSNYKGNDAARVKLTNNMGILQSEYRIEGAAMEINISHLPAGIYFLNFRTDAGSYTTKFTKL